MHTRLDGLYNCACDDCRAESFVFNLSISDKFKGVLNVGKKAFKTLYDNKGYKPEDLQKEKAYQDLINKTSDVFDFAISDNDMPEEMASALRSDAFVFGSLKANAQLFEASKFLLNENGGLKPFTELEKEFAALNVTYNKTYLEAEYGFAVSSSQMASKWSELGESSRYNLQYRTASDERVRDSHRALHDVTLPKTDPFWSSYYPPNGWRCRCTVVEVLTGKYEVSDSDKAIANGEAATTQIGKDGKNRLEIFRFNPGQKQVVFPPTHPYNKVKGAKEVRSEINSDPKYTPKFLNEYEKKTGAKIDRSIFKLLKNDVELTDKNLNPRINSEAYYDPTYKYVKVTFNNRMARSDWFPKSLIYHEFGHAIDWQNGFRQMKEVKTIMAKHKKLLSKDNGFIVAHNQLARKANEAMKNKDFSTAEKCGATADTLMSLNTKYGWGHSKSYFANPGKKEAEFIAHMFENKFAGNEIFKEVLPDLYQDTLKLFEELEAKVK